MKQRIISGVIIALLVVALGLPGGPVLGTAMLIVSLIGFHELVTVMGAVEGSRDIREIASFRPQILEMAGMVMTAVYYVGLMLLAARREGIAAQLASQNSFTLGILLSTFFVFMLIYVFTFPRYRSEQIMEAMFSFLYIPVMLSFVYRARMLPHGLIIYALVFVSSSICDVCALAAGMAFGKHKMAPVLSPKKTVEGAIGGILGSALVAYLIGAILHRYEPATDLRLVFTAIGALSSLLGMTGDLAASAVKRNHDIKDYSNLIPGHGGILDRFDSIIFTAPVIWVMGVLLVLPRI